MFRSVAEQMERLNLAELAVTDDDGNLVGKLFLTQAVKGLHKISFFGWRRVDEQEIGQTLYALQQEDLLDSGIILCREKGDLQLFEKSRHMIRKALVAAANRGSGNLNQPLAGDVVMEGL
jgi:hypothetical protein